MKHRTLDDSLWSHLASDGPKLQQLRGEFHTDVAVVGAGFLGLSIALHLAKSGVTVALIEAEEPGFGASGRNTGFVAPRIRTQFGFRDVAIRVGNETAERLVRLVEQSGDTLFNLIHELKIECAAERSGWLEPAHCDSMIPILENRAYESANRGRPVKLLGLSETKTLVGTDKYRAALFDESGGQINPLAYARGLARACLDNKVLMFARSRVEVLKKIDNNWHAITSTSTIRADQVILATNAMLGPLVPELAASFIPVNVFQVATEPLDAIANSILPKRNPVSDTRRHTFAVRRSPDDRLMTGGIVLPGPKMSTRASRQFAARLAAFFPDAAPYRIRFVWNGLVAQTSNSLPQLYTLEPGLNAVIGCNGRGVAITSSLGKAVAQLISGELSSQDFPLPETKPKPIRGHFFHKLVPSIWLPWVTFRDWIETR